MTHWTHSNIPPQRGRTAVVTGTGGLGFEVAYALAAAGARVIIAGRNPERGRDALARIRRDLPQAELRFEELDLASLASIQAFGQRLQASLSGLDILVNNAAVMTPPRREITRDGFELQFGTNHLGHFALTAALLPLLRQSGRARVVSLSSVAARDAALNFEDLQSERAYRPMAAYGQSKLACLMFALELQRRSERELWGIRSIAVHPGISRTDLLTNGAGPRSAAGLARRFLWFLFQPAAQGALPALFAATAPEAQGGAYYGPDRLSETRGHPAPAKLPPQALELDGAALLWAESERLTGARFAPQRALASVRVW